MSKVILGYWTCVAWLYFSISFPEGKILRLEVEIVDLFYRSVPQLVKTGFDLISLHHKISHAEMIQRLKVLFCLLNSLP